MVEVSNQFGKRIRTDYERHRYWLLHELCQCRAQARNGLMTKGAKKALQRELAKLRRLRPTRS
jgi:hypothetical protein